MLVCDADDEATRLLAAMTRANFEGRVTQALGFVHVLMQRLGRGRCHWRCVSAMIDTLIMAGRYREALALPEAWSADARARGALDEPDAFLLAGVNLAEALYNLGRVTEAAQLLSALDADGLGADATFGLCLQRAWVAVLTRRPEHALVLLEDAPLAPASYRAELCYTRATALSALGRHAQALAQAQRGLRAAVRASSVRNGMYLLGMLEHAAGDGAQALRWLEAGFAHPYRGQGGAALVCLGDVVLQRGDRARAELAYISTLSRDPQSHACEDARARLVQLTAAC